MFCKMPSSNINISGKEESEDEEFEVHLYAFLSIIHPLSKLSLTDMLGDMAR